MEEEKDDDMEMVVRPREVVWNKLKMPFMFLPYRLFVEWTNIAELIKKYKEKKQTKPPTDIELEDCIRKIHRELHIVSWNRFGLYDLKFTYSPEQKLTEATIFRVDEQKSKRIYKNATDFQRQFLFLPLPLLVHATNVRDIALMLHTTRFPEEPVTDENLDAIIDQVHDQLHKLNRWTKGKLDDLRFLNPKDNREPIKSTRSRPRKCVTAKSKKMDPVKQQPEPSTSKANQQSDNDQIFKRTRKRAHEKASDGAQPSDKLAVCPKERETVESDSFVSSNHSIQSQKLNIDNNTPISNASGSKSNRCAKRSKQDQSDKPSEVQRKVIQMDKNEFVENTNIKELICFKYGKLPKDKLQEKIDHYFSLRFEWDDWKYDDCLNDLALFLSKKYLRRSKRSNQDVVTLVSSEDDVDEVTAKKPKVSLSSRSGASSERPGIAENSNNVSSSSKITENQIHKSSEPEKCASTQQSELYEKLKSLSIQELIEKTNINHLMAQEILKRNGTPALFEQNMKKGIDKIMRVIQKPKVWKQFELMQHLKFINVEIDPSDSSKNNESVQVEMSPIVSNDDTSPALSEKSGTQYNTEDQCAQKSNTECLDEIPESQSQSLNNNDQKDAAAVDETGVDMENNTVASKIQSSEDTQFNESISYDDSSVITIIDASNPENSQSMRKSSTGAASQAEKIIDANDSLPEHTVKIKIEPVRNLLQSQGPDSDLICEGSFIESPIIIKDSEDEMLEMDELMNGAAINNADSDSFTFTNESRNREYNAEVTPITTLDELIHILRDEPTNTLCDEPTTSETVHAEVVQSTTTITTETTMSVNSDSTIHSSPLQGIENTMSVEPKIFNKRSLSKRPIDKTNDKQMIRKRSKKTMDDTLSNIKPPKYDYPPLQLINKQSNGTVHCTVGQKSTNINTDEMSICTDDDMNLSSSPQIDSYHTTQVTQSNVIEEFDSSDEMDESNAKNQERSQIQSTTMNLLTQDNTWFLNVNTQTATDSDTCAPSSSNQQIAPSPTQNIQIPQPVTVNSTEESIAEIAPLLKVPSNFRQDITFQYLYYVNMEKFESKLLKKAGEQSLNINLILKYQCNGHSKVVVNGESLKFILNVTENEWKALNQILNTIGDIELNLNTPPSGHKSLLHRIICYLLKTTSTFSKVHIECSETDFDTARACHKPYVIDDVDVIPAFNPKFLESLKDFRKRFGLKLN